MYTSENLSEIEAPIDTLDGKRQAAILAMEHIRSQQLFEPQDIFVSHDYVWQKKVFLALCKKYDLTCPRTRQRQTSSVVQTIPVFFEKVLWPKYLQYSANLEDLFNESLVIILENIKNEKPPTPNTCLAGGKLKKTKGKKATSPSSC